MVQGNIIDRAQGCLVAAAAGDALGMPTEYISQQQLQELYGGKVTSFQKPHHSHPCRHLESGQYTDDTQQLLLLAESLIYAAQFDVKDFASRLGKWAYKCTAEPGFDRFSGNTSLAAGLELYQGKDIWKTGKFAATCGSSMRVAPLGIAYHNNLKELSSLAMQSSVITHRNADAIDGAVFTAYLVAYLINGKQPAQAVGSSLPFISSDIAEKLEYVVKHVKEEPNKVAIFIGTSEKVCETVPMALYCFLHSPENVEEVLVNAANLVPGDTDSIACIAGAFAGAYNGLSALPEKFQTQLEDREKILALGQSLVERFP